ncbi:translocase of inner membrane 8 [Tachypleus tridentatus]|uniref:translocase of inner membrane 8 n=1 Tax=Tachypleus tridentatus TaxID=6853 RepID=UPI003FD20CB4
MSFDTEDLANISSVSGEKELQEFLLVEQTKAKFQGQRREQRFHLHRSSSGSQKEVTDQKPFQPCGQLLVHQLTDVCWDKCIDKLGARLDGRTETCMINCVGRFIDTSLTIASRFTQLLQRSSSHI